MGLSNLVLIILTTTMLERHFTMLKTAMIYKDFFPRLKHREPLYKEVPSESDWAKRIWRPLIFMFGKEGSSSYIKQ